MVSIFFTFSCFVSFNRTTLQIILCLVRYLGWLRVYSHVVERLGEFIVARCCWCVLLSFVIYRKFVGGVGLLWFFSLAGACCYVLYSMLLEKFCLGVFFHFDFGLLCWRCYFERVCMFGGFVCVLALCFSLCLFHYCKVVWNILAGCAWWVVFSCFGCFLLDLRRKKNVLCFH